MQRIFFDHTMNSAASAAFGRFGNEGIMNEAIIAAARFGYGSGPAVPPPSGNVRAWLTAQLSDRRLPGCFDGLPDSAAVLVAYEEDRERRGQAAKAAAAEGKVAMPDP